MLIAMLKRCLLIVILLLAGAPAAAGIPTGPEVGARIPEFTATDQHGVERNLKNLRGPKGLLLLFFRTVDW